MDVIQTFERHLRASGIDEGVINQVSRSVRMEFGGQATYIHKPANDQRQSSLLADHQHGYSIARLAVKYRLSERRIRELLG